MGPRWELGQASEGGVGRGEPGGLHLLVWGPCSACGRMTPTLAKAQVPSQQAWHGCPGVPRRAPDVLWVGGGCLTCADSNVLPWGGPGIRGQPWAGGSQGSRWMWQVEPTLPEAGLGHSGSLELCFPRDIIGITRTRQSGELKDEIIVRVEAGPGPGSGPYSPGLPSGAWTPRSAPLWPQTPVSFQLPPGKAGCPHGHHPSSPGLNTGLNRP